MALKYFFDDFPQLVQLSGLVRIALTDSFEHSSRVDYDARLGTVAGVSGLCRNA